jgi:hypothetical protein
VLVELVAADSPGIMRKFVRTKRHARKWGSFLVFPVQFRAGSGCVDELMLSNTDVAAGGEPETPLCVRRPHFGGGWSPPSS